MSHPVVAVYARARGGRWELAGHADLLMPRILLADQELATALAAHHTPVETVAHLSWMDRHEVRGELIDIVESECPEKPNVRLVMTSDDLVAMTNGELKFAHAWATGRVRLDASIRDLLRLRTMMNKNAKSS